MRLAEHFDRFFATNFINPMIPRHIYHMTLILKSRSWLENVKSLPYGRVFEMGVILVHGVISPQTRDTITCDKVKVHVCNSFS